MRTKSIVAIGKACSMVNAMPDRIRAAAGALGIQPALRINGVEHFDEADVTRIGEFLSAAIERQRQSNKSR